MRYLPIQKKLNLHNYLFQEVFLEMEDFNFQLAEISLIILTLSDLALVLISTR